MELATQVQILDKAVCILLPTNALEKGIKPLCPPKPDIGIMVRVFANGPEDQGSIPGQVIPKTQKMVQPMKVDMPLNIETEPKFRL